MRCLLYYAQPPLIPYLIPGLFFNPGSVALLAIGCCLQFQSPALWHCNYWYLSATDLKRIPDPIRLLLHLQMP